MCLRSDCHMHACTHESKGQLAIALGIGQLALGLQNVLCVAGQAVFGQASGSLGSHVRCSEASLVPMPPNATCEAAATVPTVFITADSAFCHGTTLHPLDRVLVHAAAGQQLHTQPQCLQPMVICIQSALPSGVNIAFPA